MSRRSRIRWLLPLALGALLACDRAADLAATATGAGTTYPYLHVDVFTDQPLTGNQLAVFLEPEGLSGETMQDLAREMNFSETTFVFPPEERGTDFRVRIFARNREMDFAGHPTIGTAYALARAGLIPVGQERVVLGEGIGPVPVELSWKDGAIDFAWMDQRQPEFGRAVEDVEALAAALGLEAGDVMGDHPVQEVSCGSNFWFVPLVTRAAVDAATPNRARLLELFEREGLDPRGLFVFSPEPGDDDATVYSRMLGFSGFEDPATGSASGPLGAYLVHHGLVPPERASSIVSRQGVQMMRPSRIYIDIGLDGEVIDRVRVGGRTVFVGEASVTLP